MISWRCVPQYAWQLRWPGLTGRPGLPIKKRCTTFHNTHAAKVDYACDSVPHLL